VFRVLVVDNEKDLLDLVEWHLTRSGVHVARAETGHEALDLLGAQRFDLVILDILMDGMDGYSVLKHIRDEGRDIPVILLSALQDTENIVYGLTLGADDYVTKPFSPAELAARVHAHIRRATGAISVDQSIAYTYGDLTLHPSRQVLFKRNRPIPLSLLETKLMTAFMKYPNQPISRARLFREAWGFDEADDNSVNVYITLLRKKIEDNPREPKYIQTVRGIGYMLAGDAD
jgi:DNA-binding response OmpR family regulator